MPDTAHLQDILDHPAVRAVLASGGVWLWEADLETETTVYQDGFWEQYGHDARSLTETFDFLRVVHSGDLARVSSAWRAHLDGETEVYESEWRLRTAGGDWRWIRSRGTVTERSAAGRPLRMIGAYTDATPLKSTQTDLEASTAELEALFRSAKDGLAVISRDGEFLRVNESAVQLLQQHTGNSVREGMNLAELQQVYDGMPVQTDIRAAMAGIDVPTRVLDTPDSSWLEFSYWPVKTPSRDILGVAVTLRDITANVRMERARAQALRLESLGLLASGIAHDFNNLLSAIVGNIELAAMTVSDAEAKDGLADARQAADRASELIQQLLAYAGENQPTKKPLELSRLTGEIVRYARKIPGRQAEIVEELPLGLPNIEGDATQLRQVVLNLIVNALDATGPGGSVLVRTSMVGRPAASSEHFALEPAPAAAYLALMVRDDGEGMTEPVLGRIFDPFYTTKASGHGLGLASVLGAVRSHGGGISVASAPGQGSTFTVYLPVQG